MDLLFSLPLEVKDKIFRYLKKSDLLHMASCSSEWYNTMVYYVYREVCLCPSNIGKCIMYSYLDYTKTLKLSHLSLKKKDKYSRLISWIEPKQLTSLIVYYSIFNNEEIERILRRFPSLQKVSISRCGIDRFEGPSLMKTICTLYSNHLIELNLSHNYLKPFVYEDMQMIANVVSIDLHETNVNNDSFLIICECLHNVKRLIASHCKVTDNGLSDIIKLKCLIELNLRQKATESLSITDNGLLYLKDNVTLEKLNLDGNQHITEAGLKHLNRLKKLRCLNINSIPVIHHHLFTLVTQFPLLKETNLYYEKKGELNEEHNF